MAGDWIKMRTALLTHPKVNGIARILEQSVEVGRVLSRGVVQPMSEIVTRNVMRNVTVASLLTLWSNANEHSVGGVIRNADFSYIDDLLEIPGFGDALSVVGWAVYLPDEHSVLLPNFSEYNTCGEERRSSGAERQKRHRDKKRAEKALRDGDVTSDVTSHNREEKRREDKRTNKHLMPVAEKNLLLADVKSVFINLELNNGSEWPVTNEYVADLKELYPAVDVEQELRNQRGWLQANPRNRKTSSGIKKFISNWLAKAQNAAPRIGGSTSIDFGASLNRLLGGMKPRNESEALAWVSAQADGIRSIREIQAVPLWTKHLSAAYAKTGEQPYTGE